MRAAKTFAELMGKYAKLALALLYALQIATLCREQIVHLYHVAISAAHRGHADPATVADDGHEESTGILGSVMDKAKRLFGEHGHHRIAAAPVTSTTLLAAIHEKGHGKEHHPNEEKYREKRHRRDDGHLRFIANLYSGLRRQGPPEGTADGHRSLEMIRLMRFAAT